MRNLCFRDCYANKLDLSVKEITNGKYLVSRTYYGKRINAEMEKGCALTVILEYKSTKRIPQEPAEKRAYQLAYNNLCYDVAEHYKECLK